MRLFEILVVLFITIHSVFSRWRRPHIIALGSGDSLGGFGGNGASRGGLGPGHSCGSGFFLGASRRKGGGFGAGEGGLGCPVTDPHFANHFGFFLGTFRRLSPLQVALVFEYPFVLYPRYLFYNQQYVQQGSF